MKKILTLLLLATLTSAVGWGEETVCKTLTFSSSTNSQGVSSYTASWTATVGGFTWDIVNFNNNNNEWNYIRAGRKDNASVAYISTKSKIEEAVTKVVVTVDNFTVGKINSTKLYIASNSDFTQNVQTISLPASLGAMTYTVQNPAEKMFYKLEYDCASGSSNGLIQISKVEYYYNPTPPVVINKVTGIGELKSLTSGDMVELYLPDGNNARVTHVESKAGGTIDAYVRDNTGAVRMTGISPNRPMAYDQHLAGWITGKYTVGSDGIPQFEPDEDLTNTAFLVIADRVTENETEPVEVASDEISDHLGDWVTVKDVRVGAAGSVGVTNKFNLAYYNSSQLYTGALVDIHGIAASGTLYPVDDKDEYPITHVVDAQENFVSPTKSISNTQVRFRRAMSNSNYYLLTVPFEFDDFEGEVFEYKGVSLGQVGTYNYNGSQVPIMGGVMHFERYYGNLQPGTPYLVKPSSALTEITLGGVTLSNAAAGSVKFSLAQQNTAGINLMADEQPAYVGDYTLVGTYSPQVLPKDESTAILDGNTVSWTSVAASTAIDGTEAYVTLPAGAGVKFDVPGNGIVTAISEMSIDNVAPREAVIYNIMGVRMTRPLSELPPGIYIVNGKKIVKF